MNRTARAFACLATLLPLATCSDQTAAPATETVTIPVNFSLASLPAVRVVVVEVTAADIDPAIVVNLTIDTVAHTAQGTVTIPAGSDRTITIRAYDAGGIETHRGSTTLNIAEGTVPTVTVTLMPLTGTVPITVSFGAITVTVSPALDTLDVGDTLRMQAVVKDTAGQALAVNVNWASTNPLRGFVDTAGLITAMNGGVVQIVASYGGAAGVATLFIERTFRVFEDSLAFFAAAGGATLKVSYPTSRDLTTAPYVENGVTLTQASGYNNWVAPHTPVFTGNVLAVSGAENLDITLASPIGAFGLWMQDGLTVGNVGCTGLDSRFTVTFRDALGGIVGLTEIDPPADVAFFVGFTFTPVVEGVAIREIGATADLFDPYCENDFFGRIYTK